MGFRLEFQLAVQTIDERTLLHWVSWASYAQLEGSAHMGFKELQIPLRQPTLDGQLKRVSLQAAG